jgi:outer membrane protein assembly factor BamB
MVPDISRRTALASGGALAATVLGWRSTGNAGGTRPESNSPQDVAPETPTEIDGWPMSQRDPGGTSYAPEATPPRDDFRVRWTQSLDTELGFHYQPTPIVSDGRVYAVGHELLCADAADGSVLFRISDGARSPPAVATARAYRRPTLAFVDHRGMNGLDSGGGLTVAGQRFGTRRWQTSRESGFNLFGRPPAMVPPVAADGLVFGHLAGELTAVDASSGEVQWRADNGDRRPAVRDGTVYVAQYPGGIVAFDTQTGEKRTVTSEIDVVPISLTATKDRLVAATDDGVAGVTYDGTLAWEFAPDDLSRDRGAVAVADGTCYAGFRGEEDNYLLAFDAESGTEKWRISAAPEVSPAFAPPSVANGVVYIPTEDSGFAAVDADDGHVRWRFDPESRHTPLSPAALVGDLLYVQGEDELYALEEA